MSARTIRKNRHRADKGAGRKTWRRVRVVEPYMPAHAREALEGMVARKAAQS